MGKTRTVGRAVKPPGGPVHIGYTDEIPSSIVKCLQALPIDETAAENEEPPAKKRRKTVATRDMKSIAVAQGRIKLSRRCSDRSLAQNTPMRCNRVDKSLSISVSDPERPAMKSPTAPIQPEQLAIGQRLHIYASSSSSLGGLDLTIKLWHDEVDSVAAELLRACPAGDSSRTEGEGAMWTSVDLHFERRGQNLNLSLHVILHWNEALMIPAKLSNTQRLLIEQAISSFYPPQVDESLHAGDETWSPMDFYEAAHVPDPEDSDALAIDVPDLTSTLYPYQKRTLQWLLRREGVDWAPGLHGQAAIIKMISSSQLLRPPNPFRVAQDMNGQEFHVSDLYQVATTDPTPFLEAEPDVRGGILAEEMGLGKTLEIISLILLHQRELSPLDIPVGLEDGLRPTGATLIVSPESLRPQWLSELARHAPYLKCKHYTGCGGGKAFSKETERALVEDLASHDVVVTTYSVLTSELHFAEDPPDRSMRRARQYHRPKSPLVQISWWRVCLDEAQMIESGVSKAANVARLLPRVNAWGITGTPVKNDVSDLLGLLRFLQYSPYAYRPQTWQLLVTKHKSLFRELFGRISLRHTKRMVRDQIALPAQKRFVISVPLTTVEETFYQNMFQNIAKQCNLDANGVPLVDDWDQDDYEDTMRRGLNMLRRTALHPEIFFLGRRTLGNRGGVIRTVDQVLDLMIEQSDATIRIEQRALFNARLTTGQLLENGPRVKEAQAIWEQVKQEITQIVTEARTGLNEAIEEAKKTPPDQTALSPTDEGDTDGDDGDEFSGSAKVGDCRRRLRHALEIQHKAVFFCANALFQIKDNKDMTDPDSEEFQNLQKLEEEEYENAKLIRREILFEARRKATKLMEKLSKRASDQSFVMIPELVAKDIKGIESRHVLEQLEELYEALNDHANQLDEWREEAIKLLTRPLIDEEDDIELTGEEFGESAQMQDELSAYMEIIRASIADRQDAISGQSNERTRMDMRTARQQAKHDEGFVPKLRLQLLDARDKIKPPAGLGSIRSALYELRALNIKHGRESLSRAQLESAIVAEQMKDAQANLTAQDKACKEMELELELFRTTLNARMEFYRQFQAISDMLNPYEGSKEPSVMDDFIQAEQSMRRKLEITESKHRYLLNLKESGAKSNEPRFCVICQTTFTIGVLTVCGHQFCKECMTLWYKQHHNCPMCKRQLRPSNLHDITIKPQEVKVHEEAPLSELPTQQRRSPSKKTAIYSEFSEEKLAEIQNIEIRPPSFTTKVDALVRHVLWLRESDPGSKSIIFSQFNDFLAVVANAFDRHRIGYTSIDKLSGITRFKEDPGVECFLLHARAHSSGLNLVNASHVFLCEPILNTALELQAIARVDRIGQQNETTVWLYILQDTVEESIYNLSVQRRMKHMDRTDKGKSKESTPELLDARIEEANTLEMENAALSRLMSKDRSAGEVVDRNDLWACLFGHVAQSQGAEGQDERRDNRAVMGFLAAEAAEQRRNEQQAQAPGSAGQAHDRTEMDDTQVESTL